MQRPGERRLAAAGEAGEEEHQALLAGRRPVGVDDRGDLVVGVVAVARRPVSAEDRVGAGVRRDDLDARGRGRRRRRRARPAVRRPRRRPAAGAAAARVARSSADGRERRGCRCRPGRAAPPAVERAQPVELVARSRASATGTNVAPACCSRTWAGVR